MTVISYKLSENLFEKIRADLIVDGIKGCEELLLEQDTETGRAIYNGNIKGFEECRDLRTLEDFRRRIGEVRKEAFELSCKYYDDGQPQEVLNDYWERQGVAEQLNFVYQRLLFFSLFS